MFKLWKKSRYYLIKPLDILFLLPLLLIFSKKTESGKQVEIFVDGKLKFIYSLNDDRNIEIKGNIGSSTIEIKNGKIRMVFSPCPDKLCMKQGFIGNRGESIVCVPNRIVIKIKGENIDGITE